MRHASILKVGDESMSAICFRTTAKGNLPHFSYTFRKPEPLGTEFKKVACSVTGALLLIEVQRGKEGMKHSKHQQELGATEDFNKRMVEATNGLCQKSIKGGTTDCFLFDNWFATKKAAKGAMEVGAELIGTVKTNTKGFCKETIYKLTKDWDGSSYLVLRIKPMVTGDRPRIAIGYKYNARKVLSFIVTDNKGRKIQVFPIYLVILTNLLMLPFALLLAPFLCQKQSAVNEVDSNNKSRQSDLALEKWWVTQCSCIRLCTTVAMGMTITNCWELFRYGVKRNRYEKLIGTSELI